ncbi:MAG: apolipoprotein N-acyltransferase [Actinomyces sp.]|nr:apolipoprotein N-acyltransferase [Actinomyces sp.]MCI1641143.1 apolipoprotein N-acyltransferase [Actinomyces sp.]MCI1662338.1 apolipoprotein N-acyltransferase [Actinomyces sp.]MCI1691062.1 apolipoprotein N-acyltransferase [Actinomyces sp.]MCI1788679.1 apolipoprotein N-acyltransferase [Actinomyces sp.]MCI1829274.1 apolipoprotein N-acyltransferase [Actinomyces sp.]
MNPGEGVVSGGRPPLRRSRDYLCVAVAAAGLWASFPGTDWWWLTVPSLAVLVALVDRVGAGRASWYAALVASGFWLGHIEWVRVATGGWLPWVALAATQVVPVAAWAWTVSVARVWRWTRPAWGQAVLFALTWTGFEQLRSRVPFGGFPWANIAYTQVDAPLGRLAPWGGEVLVSFLVMVCAVLLRRAFSLSPAHDAPQWWARPAGLAVALALLAAPLAIDLPTQQEAGSLRVGVVQGDVEIPGDQTYQIVGKVTGNNARVTRELAESGRAVDLVVWGEDSVDKDPRTNALTSQLVADAVEEVGVPTIVGWQEIHQTTRENWIGVWEPGSGLREGFYGKQHPVPFGEYIPWRSFVSHLATEAARVNVDMVAVDNPSLLEVPSVDGRSIPMTVGICFEVAYEPLLSEGVRAGGQIIVIPTNNYHFQYSAESDQQAQMLRFRAMEFSRSAIQASTNGTSLIVRPDGSVIAESGKQVATFLTGEVPLRTSLTLAARMGDFPDWLVIVLTVALAVGSGGASIALGRRSA